MQYVTKVLHGVTVFSMNGAILGGPEASALNAELHRLVDHGSVKVVIDLSGVTLMNSSGLGMLIGGYTTLRNAGGDMRLACVGEKIQTLITITKLKPIFPSYASVDDAVNSLL